MRRLLDLLRLPEEAGRVLADSRFWTPAGCRAYLDACDRQVFQAPKDGLAMARLGPHLVHLLPSGRRRRALLVHALAVLGSAFRASGLLFEAEGAYRQAFALAPEVDPLEAADLHRRYAVLLLERRRFEDALESAERAVETFTSRAPRGPGEYCLGAALLQRGVVHLVWSEAILGEPTLRETAPHEPTSGDPVARRSATSQRHALNDFGLALLVLDPVENERQYYATVANLAHLLTHSSEADLLREGVRRLREARELPSCRAGSMACAKLQVTEGLLVGRLGAFGLTVRLLAEARERFDDLGAWFEVVQTSVDLATFYRQTGDLVALSRLADDTWLRCQRLRADAELIAVLETWRQALIDATADATDDADCLEAAVRARMQQIAG